MKAYFKQGWGITFIILGIVLLILNMMLLNSRGSNPMGLLMGAMITAIGALYLTRPAFELRSNELVMFNLLGMELKRYPFGSLRDFQVIGGKIYIASEGSSKKVRISKAMIRSTDWEDFMRRINGEDITRELHNI
jgi:hypothetical protein